MCFCVLYGLIDGQMQFDANVEVYIACVSTHSMRLIVMAAKTGLAARFFTWYAATLLQVVLKLRGARFVLLLVGYCGS